MMEMQATGNAVRMILVIIDGLVIIIQVAISILAGVLIGGIMGVSVAGLEE